MVRLALLLLLLVFIARAFWRVMDGVIAGLRGPSGSSGQGPQGVHMVRDPICGTFVVPEHSLLVTDGSRRVYFCSTACRDKYRVRSA